MMAAIENRSVEELAMDGERERTVQELLTLLKPDERAIIILRYWNDLSYEEIAEMLRNERRRGEVTLVPRASGVGEPDQGTRDGAGVRGQHNGVPVMYVILADDQYDVRCAH